MNTAKLSATINNSAILASVVLLVALAFEITRGREGSFSARYAILEGVVCSVYLLKYGYDIYSSLDRRRFFAVRLPILLLSLPYLSLSMVIGVKLGHNLSLIFGLMPIVRAIISFYRLFVRLVSAQSIDKILLAYLMITVLFSYIAALIFYDCEVHVNPQLEGFGNAIWWAWMSLTTVGAAIYPVTTIGKILSVVLPLLGMMLLPLFTSYIIALHRRRG